MSTKNNIDEYYNELVGHMHECRQATAEDEPDIEPYEAEARVLDEELAYYANQGYVLAHAIQAGYIKWGEPFEWQNIYDMLIEDMNSEEK